MSWEKAGVLTGCIALIVTIILWFVDNEDTIIIKGTPILEVGHLDMISDNEGLISIRNDGNLNFLIRRISSVTSYVEKGKLKSKNDIKIYCSGFYFNTFKEELKTSVKPGEFVSIDLTYKNAFVKDKLPVLIQGNFSDASTVKVGFGDQSMGLDDFMNTYERYICLSVLSKSIHGKDYCITAGVKFQSGNISEIDFTENTNCKV